MGSEATRYELEGAFEKFGTVKNVWIAKRPPGKKFRRILQEVNKRWTGIYRLFRFCFRVDGGSPRCRGRCQGTGWNKVVWKESQGKHIFALAVATIILNSKTNTISTRDFSSKV